MDSTQIRSLTQQYILTNILGGQAPEGFNDDTPLISGGLIDSITTLHLVDFLEKTFNIEFQPHEVDRENLDSINRILQFVQEKLKG